MSIEPEASSAQQLWIFLSWASVSCLCPQRAGLCFKRSRSWKNGSFTTCLIPAWFCLPAQTFQALDSLYSACFIAELWHQAKQIKHWTCELPKSLALDTQIMNSALGYLGSVVFIFHPQHSLFSNELSLHTMMVPIVCPQKIRGVFCQMLQASGLQTFFRGREVENIYTHNYLISLIRKQPLKQTTDLTQSSSSGSM